MLDSYEGPSPRVGRLCQPQALSSYSSTRSEGRYRPSSSCRAWLDSPPSDRPRCCWSRAWLATISRSALSASTPWKSRKSLASIGRWATRVGENSKVLSLGMPSAEYVEAAPPIRNESRRDDWIEPVTSICAGTTLVSYRLSTRESGRSRGRRRPTWPPTKYATEPSRARSGIMASRFQKGSPDER